MSRFLEDALNIFETAKSAAGGPGSQMAILIDDAGALRMVDSAGWRPEALQRHYGARTVYQITRATGGVKVAGYQEPRGAFSRQPVPLLYVSPYTPRAFRPWASGC